MSQWKDDELLAMEEAQQALVDVSAWIDRSPANAARDREAATWGRLAKIQEEAGEVSAAFISYTGQNPRKPRVEDALIQVADELLDVAVTALAAYEHLTDHQGLSFADLMNHILKIHARTVAVGPPVADTGHPKGGCIENNCDALPPAEYHRLHSFEGPLARPDNDL